METLNDTQQDTILAACKDLHAAIWKLSEILMLEGGTRLQKSTIGAIRNGLHERVKTLLEIRQGKIQ